MAADTGPAWGGTLFTSAVDVENFLTDVRTQAQKDIDTLTDINKRLADMTGRWADYDQAVINMGAAMSAAPGVPATDIKYNVTRLRKEAAAVGVGIKKATADTGIVAEALTHVRTGSKVFLDLIAELRAKSFLRGR